MALLVPDTGLLFWMTLSFAVVLIMLGRFGFPMIIKGMNKRRTDIEKALQSASEAQLRLAAAGEEAASIVEAANAQRNTILKEAQQLRATMLDQARANAERDAAAQMVRARAEAEELRRRTISDAMGQIAALSVRIAAVVVGEELDMDDNREKLIERLIKQENG